MTRVQPSNPFSIRIRPLPPNFLPREASLIFALVYDEIASVSILDYAIAASFKSSSACIATARLLDGKHIFGPEFPPISVEYAFLPSPELPTLSFSQIHFNNQDQISSNLANISSGQNNVQPQASHHGTGPPLAHPTTVSAQSSHGNILPPRPLNLQMPPHDRSRFVFGDPVYLDNSKNGHAPIDFHDYAGKSLFMMEPQIDAREYESLLRDPWTNPQPHPAHPQNPLAHREVSNKDLFLHSLSLAQSNLHLPHLQAMPSTQSSMAPPPSNIGLPQSTLALALLGIPSSQPLLHVPSSQPHLLMSSSASSPHNRNMAPSQPNIQIAHPLHNLAKPLLLPAGPPAGPAPPGFDWSRAATSLSQSSSNQGPDQISPPPNGSERRRTSLAFFSGLLPSKDVVTGKDLGESSADASPTDTTTSQKDAPADFSLLARVPPPANPADQNPPCNTLYVGNLPPDATEAELRQLFAPQSGFRRLLFRTKNVTTLLALQSSLNNHAHGPMCFVEFEDVAHATRALAELYGKALPRPNGGNGKGGIRLLFSKNPLGVRGPGQPRRPPQTSSTSTGTSSQASTVQLGMPAPVATTISSNSSVGNYGYLNYHAK